MTDHVRYIDKTRDYYRSVGYTQDYQWARNESCGFTPLSKPLRECKIGLVSTAAMVTLADDGTELEPVRMMGSNKLEVFSLPSDWPLSRVRSTSEDHDRFQTDMADFGAYFPKELLKELAEDGIIGGFADECWRILPNYSKRKVEHVDAPEVLQRARALDVDAVAITPV